jgi:hypothetical protein
MLQSTNNEIVKDLLGLLISRNDQLSWKKRCLYTNGVDSCVMEIKICQKNSPEDGSARQLSRLVYNPCNGMVMQMKYHGNTYHQPGTIVDVLLDLINAETQEVVF